MRDDLFVGPPVDLESVLAAREARVARRLEVFARSPRPVVSLSVVMPGPVKDCPASRLLRDAALGAVVSALGERQWAFEVVPLESGAAGSEALISVAADAIALKGAMIAQEDRHPLGRLWDLDVVDPNAGQISRHTLGAGPRRCFVCDQPAHVCARSRAHALDELLAAMKTVIDAARRPART